MEYKYELHCHSSMVSKCGKTSPEEICKIYKEQGYSGIVITEHYNPHTFIYSNIFAPQKSMKHFLSSYYEMKKYESEDFSVMLGIELRHHLSASDYLIYGVTPEWLLKQGNMLNWWEKKRYEEVNKAGFLVFQAHPFRQGKICNPKYVDGIEVFNGKANDNQNKKALDWAKEHGKMFSSGSDFHKFGSCRLGGIITEAKITNNEELISVLKSGKYKLIAPGEREKTNDV